MPSPASTSSALSASSGFSIRSRSWRVSGPPRAQLARLPPSRNGMPASRSAAPARLRVFPIASNDWSFSIRRAATRHRAFRLRGCWVRGLAMSDDVTIRVAAAGDIHASEANAEEVAAAFAGVDGTVDLVLLAGDLTTYGQPSQAEVLAAACRPLETPVITVLGNHDWHCAQRDELVSVLEDAGVCVLDPGHTVRCVQSVEVGIVGAKGFVGGFPGL